ncbi:MAG: HpcH/HpaI aldolase/citrate lyase family protein [Acidimicrobiales bacterium]
MSLTPRSLFFVPGSRPDMIAKIPRWQPDVAVVDLEDAVAGSEKEAARRSAVAALADLDAGPTVTLIRVNASGSPWHGDDVRAVADSRARGVVLPKYQSVEEIAALRSGLDAGALVVVGLETVLGVADSRSLLAAGVDAAYFGAEDYIADIGGRRTQAGAEVLWARSQVMAAARLAGVGAIDQTVVAVRDDEAFVADATAGRAIGYTGKICVHPRQVALAHEAFTPTKSEVDHARAVVAAAGSGVAVVDGEMVDDVHVRMAETVLDRSARR